MAAPRGPAARGARAGASGAWRPIGDGFAVVVESLDGREERHVDVDAERAYARALLAVLGA